MSEIFDELLRGGLGGIPPELLEFEQGFVRPKETYSLLSIEDFDLPLPYERMLSACNLARLNANIQMLNELNTAFASSRLGSYPALRYLIQLYPQYDGVLQALTGGKTQRTSRSVVREFATKGEQLFGNTDRSIEAFMRTLQERDNSAGTKVIVSGGHNITRSLYAIAMSGLDPDAAAILVLDRHLDFYHNETSQLDNRPHKGNFLRFMMTEHDYPNPNSIIVAGVNDDTHTGMVLGETKKTQSLRTHREFFSPQSPYRSRVQVLPQNSFRNKAGRYDAEASYQSGYKSAQFAHRNGAQAIYVSIDLDVMSPVTGSGLVTGLEYSPLAFYVSLGAQEIRALVKPIKSALQQKNVELAEALYQQFIATLMSTGFPAREAKQQRIQNLAPNFTENPGLPEGAVRDYLRGVADFCRRGGLLMGIPQDRGGVYVGDVSEAGGKDINNQTAQRIYRLTQMMHSAANLDQF